MLPSFDRKFSLATDASKHGIGCVLSQQNNKGQWKPIAFAGRAFTKAEQKTITPLNKSC